MYRFGSKRFLAAVVLGGLAVSATVVSAQPDAWFRAGQAYRSGVVDKDVVAVVGGIPVTRGELRMARALAELNNEKSPVKLAVDERSLMGRLIDQKSVVAEAARRGLRATAAETAKHIEDVRQDIRNAPQARADFDEFLNGMGLSESEWFASDFARSRYGEVFAIGKLRAQVLAGVSSSDAVATWEQFERAIRASTKVEILDPNLR